MFGKWYDGEGNEIVSRCPDLCRLETSHERVHAPGKQAVAAAGRGDKCQTPESYEYPVVPPVKMLIFLIWLPVLRSVVHLLYRFERSQLCLDLECRN